MPAVGQRAVFDEHGKPVIDANGKPLVRDLCRKCLDRADRLFGLTRENGLKGVPAFGDDEHLLKMRRPARLLAMAPVAVSLPRSRGYDLHRYNQAHYAPIEAKILAALEKLGDRWVTRSQIQEVSKTRTHTSQRVLAWLRSHGQVQTQGIGPWMRYKPKLKPLKLPAQAVPESVARKVAKKLAPK